MILLRLAFAQIINKKTRSVLTFLSIVAAFLLFGFLMSINGFFERKVDLAGADRIICTHKTSLIQMLPISYEAKIASITGVKSVTHATWFGGQYKSPRNFFPKFAVEPDLFLQTYPKIVLVDNYLRAWNDTPSGAIAGRATAEKYGWKVGDKIQIEGDIWPKADGSQLWEFDLVGIFDGREASDDTTQFLFRYDYFDRTRSHSQGLVGYYIVRSENPQDNDRISHEIDKMFQNSSAETKTSSEAEYTKSIMNQIGDISKTIKAVLVAVIFTLILVINNTVTQSVRERIKDIAIMKTLGLSDLNILKQVLLEAAMMIVPGAMAGMALAELMIKGMEKTLESIFNSIIIMPAEAWGYALALALFISMVAALPPAISALRLKIIDAFAEGNA